VFAAKAATPTIPIVFYTANDPVSIGLVASLGRPGGNVTGVTSLGVETAPKRLELLRELLPGATRVGLLVNPTNTTITDATLKEMETAARATGATSSSLSVARWRRRGRSRRARSSRRCRWLGSSVAKRRGGTAPWRPRPPG